MSSGSTILLFGRMGISLAIILGMIWLAAKVVRRKGPVRATGTMQLEVLGRRSIGRRSNLLVVRAGERTLLVGATDAQVGLVADLTPVHDLTDRGLAVGDTVEVTAVEVEDEPLALARREAAPAPARSARINVLDAIRELTTRRT